VLNTDYTISGKTITVVEGRTIPAWFRVRTPAGATWSIVPQGDTAYFDIEPSSGTVDPNVNSGKIYFDIIPNQSLAKTRDVSITLQFYLQFMDGTVYDLNSEVNFDNNGVGWTIIYKY